MKNQKEQAGDQRRWRGILKGIFIFIVVFAAMTAVIQVDTEASNTIGNEAFFTSSFIRSDHREIKVKIMGFETLLAGGLAVETEETNE